MRVPQFLSTLPIIAFSLVAGCSLSNRVEDIKVLCSIKDVNPSLTYVRILNPEAGLLNAQQLATLSAEFIHEDGRSEALSASPRGCLSLPKAKGQLSVRSSAEQEWVAYTNELSPASDLQFRDLSLIARGQLNVELACPDKGLLANQQLANALLVKNNKGDLQNLQLTVTVTDKNGTSLGTLFTKNFGNKTLDLPTNLSLDTLTEGEYAVQMNLRDSFYGANPKSLLASGQCPLVVKRSCASESDLFDPETVSCKPKLCDGKYRVGEFWSDELASGKGQGLFTCRIKDGDAEKVATDATCKAGYFETHGACVGARQVEAGFNHSCALLESDEVSCWGYNVFGKLGASQSLGNSGQVLGPQPPVPLAEPASAVAVGAVSSCALLQSGRVQCWGSLPSGLDAKGFVQFQVYDKPQFVKTTDGSDLNSIASIVLGGGPDSDTFCAITKEKFGLCWGKDLFSHSQTLQFGNWLHPQRVFPQHRIQQLAATDRDICVVDADNGKVYCQGSALGPVIKDITPETIASEVTLDIPFTQSIYTRSITKCSIVNDGRFFCWGLYNDSENSDFFTFPYGRPDIRRILTAPVERKELEPLKEASMNAQMGCFLTLQNKPICELGPPSSIPRPMTILKADGQILTDITTLSAGYWHGCGVHASGQVYCWGDNQFGRLGNGTIAESGDDQGIPQSLHATLILSP